LPVENQAVSLLRHAIDNGVNYIDLGTPGDLARYDNAIGQVSRALVDRYRSKVRVAATLPPSPSSLAECDRFLDSLGQLGVDFLFLGWLNNHTWEKLQRLGILEWAEKTRSQGRFRYLGFSFHDDFQSLRTILNAYNSWTLCQFEYSFMDLDHHPGHGGLQLAARRGLAVIVSSPLKGGRLTRRLPDSVFRLLANTGVARTPAVWALRWVWNHPEVSTLVDNINSIEQLSEDLSVADTVIPSSLTVSEEVLMSQVREAYRKLRPVPCTTCRSCLPCPVGIDIPRIFELYNEAVMYDDRSFPSACFHIEGHHIEDCNECGLCLQRCGMTIAIPEKLKDAAQLLTLPSID
jgi:predicted aldo/keto reductase-like oxidoreductase